MDLSISLVLVVVHPLACDSSREKNTHDVRGDHGHKHYAIHQQHPSPTKSLKLLPE